jgi:hypothetical protein
MIENLPELGIVHQCITGPANFIPDAISRHPLLGPQRLAPRGVSYSARTLLSKLPVDLKSSALIHVHAASDTQDVRRIVQEWHSIASAATPFSPSRQGPPPPADLAILIPRPEQTPVTLASHLLSPTRFAILMPVDLLEQTHAPKLHPDAPHEDIKRLFRSTGRSRSS